MKMQKTIPAMPVQDIKSSCRYYISKLGFTIRHQEETFAIAVRVDIEIRLWAARDMTLLRFYEEI